jgi:hypothetical protein
MSPSWQFPVKRLLKPYTSSDVVVVVVARPSYVTRSRATAAGEAAIGHARTQSTIQLTLTDQRRASTQGTRGFSSDRGGFTARATWAAARGEAQ